MIKMGYPSDLTDVEWEQVKGLMPEPNRFGRPRQVDFRQVLNAIFYVDRTGCQWRYLPSDFPAWQTVYYYSRKWSCDGTMRGLHDTLVRRVRQQSGRDPEPSAACIDSQSVKTPQMGGVKKGH